MGYVKQCAAIVQCDFEFHASSTNKPKHHSLKGKHFLNKVKSKCWSEEYAVLYVL